MAPHRLGQKQARMIYLQEHEEHARVNMENILRAHTGVVG